MMDERVCPEHSGMASSIKSLRHCTDKQRETIKDLEAKVDGIMSRLNIILGGIVVSIIMLFLNLIFKTD